jgi:RNA polymerase sigma-70 factor (ECF subfamily)
MTQQQEQVLIEKARRGSSTALYQLVEPYYRSLYGFVYRTIGDRQWAEDLVQETLLRVIERIGGFVQGNFRAWLFTIARNLCVDFFRAQKKTVSLETELDGPESKQEIKDIIADISKLPEEELEEKLLRTKLQQAIARLAYEQREVLLLRVYSGLTFREIAELVGCPLNTALGRMHYALKNLRRQLSCNQTKD